MTACRHNSATFLITLTSVQGLVHSDTTKNPTKDKLKVKHFSVALAETPKSNLIFKHFSVALAPPPPSTFPPQKPQLQH